MDTVDPEIIGPLLSFTTWTLMMETEEISETSVFKSTLAQLIAREDFIKLL
jgi:hypothetical protein